MPGNQEFSNFLSLKSSNSRRGVKLFLYKFAMAEKIIQFKAKKEIFDKAASDLACSVCKIVPKDVPIFQTGEGDVLCSICQPKSELTGIFRSSVLEKLLMSLPISCKYQKNECPVVLQDRDHQL